MYCRNRGHDMQNDSIFRAGGYQAARLPHSMRAALTGFERSGGLIIAPFFP